VLEANQLLLWATLAATSAELDITGYGRLLTSGRRKERLVSAR